MAGRPVSDKTCAQCERPLRSHYNGVPLCNTHYTREYKKNRERQLRTRETHLQAICAIADKMIQEDPKLKLLINRIVPPPLREEILAEEGAPTTKPPTELDKLEADFQALSKRLEQIKKQVR